MSLTKKIILFIFMTLSQNFAFSDNFTTDIHANGTGITTTYRVDSLKNSISFVYSNVNDNIFFQIETNILSKKPINVKEIIINDSIKVKTKTQSYKINIIDNRLFSTRINKLENSDLGAYLNVNQLELELFSDYLKYFKPLGELKQDKIKFKVIYDDLNSTEFEAETKYIKELINIIKI